MAEKKRIYMWFVDVKGDVRTNEIVFSFLRDAGREEIAQVRKICADKMERSLYRVCRNDVVVLKKNRERCKLQIDFYVAEGNGPPRKWMFE